MIRIALAQINPTVGDLSGNAEKIISFIEQAASAEARIVLFPELALTGYPPEDLLFKKSFIKASKEFLQTIAAKVGSIYAVVGYPYESEGKLYNAAAVINEGEIKQVVKKSELPNYGVFDEKRYFAQAEEVAPVLIAGLSVAVTICEDIWVPEGQVVSLCERDEIDLILNLSSSPFHIGKAGERREIGSNWASRFGRKLAFCNIVGGQDELVFDGGSFVCDEKGKITASAGEFCEELLVVDLDVGDGDPAGPGEISRIVPPMDYPQNVFEALKLGVKDYVGKNGFNGVLVAVSGGIDSALTVAIAVAALGSGNVRCIAMPSKFSSESSLTDAKELSLTHNISLEVIPITDLMESFSKTLDKQFSGTEPGVAEENIQARIRGTIMMALSNKFGCLVLTTGNKSEIGVGYCTLYGDMAGGFAVIKDMPKQKVYELCEWINSQDRLPNVPRNTIDKEPSAELRPNQKDSDSLPPYSQLDPMLKLYVEDEKSIEEIIALGYSEPDVKKVAELVNRNEYKRRQSPPGVRITPKAFGKDRRVPITNRFKEWS